MTKPTKQQIVFLAHYSDFVVSNLRSAIANCRDIQSCMDDQPEICRRIRGSQRNLETVLSKFILIHKDAQSLVCPERKPTETDYGKPTEEEEEAWQRLGVLECPEVEDLTPDGRYMS